MTSDEKIAMVKTMSGETDDSVVSTYLFIAGQKVIRLTCDDGVTEVPEEWDAFHIEATVYLLNKRGGEGEQSHSENGISRGYESADLPASMLISYGITGRGKLVS